jgi:hypothetical protein
MFPSLRFMFAAVLSTLVILVIASSALISTRRPDMPVVLHPVGSRPLTASWLNDDMQSFEARFGPHAMLINASVQLPPQDLPADRSRPARIEFVATANAAADPTKSVEPAKHVDKVIPTDIAATPSVPAAPTEEPLTLVPPVAAAPPERQASLPTAAQLDAPMIVAAIEPAPVPAKDPQVASDAPAQPGDRIAIAPPAVPAAERPTFSDTSRTEKIVKPAVKRRAQIKRPKKRVVRTIAPVAAKPTPAKPNVPTNPFAALFGPANTH